MNTRIYFLDNLRTFLIFLVVVLHAGIVYEPILENSWIVSDPVKNGSIGLIRLYLDIFIMFILFFISGYFIPNSIKNKSDGAFVLSKFKRIIIPWIVAVFTMIPTYKAIFLYSRGLPQEEWYSYFHFFQRVGGDMSNFADNPVQNWLWFLPVLFIFQIIYLGLSKNKLMSFNISLKTGVILSIVIGIIYSLAISFQGLRGWYHSPFLHFQNERLLIYFMIFLLGSLCNKLKVFESSQKNKRLYIWANVALTLGLGVFTVVALNFFFNLVDLERSYFFISETIDRVAYYTSLLISMFSFLYIFIYAFRFSFNKTNRVMKDLNKNSYAVYIIHLPIIGLIALLILNVSLPAMLKFLVVVVLAYLVSNLLVSVYRKTLQKAFSKSIFPVVIPIAAILLSIAVYTSQNANALKIDQGSNSKTNAISLEKDIQTAIIEGDIDLVKRHIKAGTDINLKEPKGGSSSLLIAALFGKTEIALVLIDAGADVNLKNNDGSTPLHTAAFFCRPEIVEALIANGADLSIKNNSGATAQDVVKAPFEDVKEVYEYFETTLGPLGLKLDYEQIKITRPKIAKMLE